MKNAFTPVALTVALLAIGTLTLTAQPKPPSPDELKAPPPWTHAWPQRTVL
jgi:hypothetical protein